MIDGTLFAIPATSLHHQKVIARLVYLLEGRWCRRGLHVLPGPFSVRPGDQVVARPDVLVARDEDLTATGLPVAPMLAVEVVSEISTIKDLYLQKALYRRMGVPSYWIIDPRRPSLTVFEFDEQIAEVLGDKAFEARQPFPVRVVPAELLGTLAPELD